MSVPIKQLLINTAQELLFLNHEHSEGLLVRKKLVYVLLRVDDLALALFEQLLETLLLGFGHIRPDRLALICKLHRAEAFRTVVAMLREAENEAQEPQPVKGMLERGIKS